MWETPCTACVRKHVIGKFMCFRDKRGFPGGASDSAGNVSRGFDPWVGKIPWRRAWQPTPVFLPGESHGQRGLAGCSPRGRKESDTRGSNLSHMQEKSRAECQRHDRCESYYRNPEAAKSTPQQGGRSRFLKTGYVLGSFASYQSASLWLILSLKMLK